MAELTEKQFDKYLTELFEKTKEKIPHELVGECSQGKNATGYFKSTPRHCGKSHLMELLDDLVYEKYIEQEEPEPIWYKPDKLSWQSPWYLMENGYSCIKPRVSFIDFDKEKEEELTMDLYGKFEIVTKDNGYVVKVEAEGEEKEVIADNYADGIKLAIRNLVLDIELEKREKEDIKSEYERAKQRLEELEGQL